MTSELWIALLNFATKFGIEASIAIAKGVKGGATIDDAIAALENAKTKSAADYVKEDAATRGVPEVPINIS